jgi:hypothetical protein
MFKFNFCEKLKVLIEFVSHEHNDPVQIHISILIGTLHNVLIVVRFTVTSYCECIRIRKENSFGGTVNGTIQVGLSIRDAY